MWIASGLGSSPIRFTRTNAGRRLAVVLELAGDTHPIDVAGAIEDAIGGSRVVRPARLMSDSVLHFSDNRIAALREIVRVETGLGRSSTPARRRLITSRKRSRFRYPHTNRLTRWIRAFVDSTNSFSQSITTASRSAVNREPGSVHGVVARKRLAALRAARLAAVIDEELDRADCDVEDHFEDHFEDHVGDGRGAGVPGILTERSPMPPRCGRDGSRRSLSGLGDPHESLKTRKMAHAAVWTTTATRITTLRAPRSPSNAKAQPCGRTIDR